MNKLKKKLSREERKALYLGMVASTAYGVDNLEEILREAGEKFDKENPIEKLIN